jgi:hypothetical protein
MHHRGGIGHRLRLIPSVHLSLNESPQFKVLESKPFALGLERVNLLAEINYRFQ